MKYLLLLIVVVFVSLCRYHIYYERKINTKMEYAYFEGQRDFYNNDIRIKYEYGHWFWIKSPWDDGKIVKYNPYLINEPPIIVR